MKRGLVFLLFATLLWIVTAAPLAGAQSTTGSICVATFADANGNGLREESEILLTNVNVNLATGGAIIAAHIIGPEDPLYCFERLLPGIYTITFTASPLYRMTTAHEGTFQLDAGQRLTINDFGAVPVETNRLRAQVAATRAAQQSDGDPLELSTRLLLATGGSMMVMLFMVGVGAVILGVISGKPRRRKTSMSASGEIPLPDRIAPPTDNISRI